MQPLKLEELDIYQQALEIGESVWNIFIKWGHFPKHSIGMQFTRAADSIAANIAEGYGRYFYKERKKFYYYSRGSLMETKSWAYMSVKRSLISQSEYEELLEKLRTLHFKLNAYIKKLKVNSIQ